MVRLWSGVPAKGTVSAPGAGQYSLIALVVRFSAENGSTSDVPMLCPVVPGASYNIAFCVDAWGNSTNNIAPASMRVIVNKNNIEFGVCGRNTISGIKYNYLGAIAAYGII